MTHAFGFIIVHVIKIILNNLLSLDMQDSGLSTFWGVNELINGRRPRGAFAPKKKVMNINTMNEPSGDEKSYIK